MSSTEGDRTQAELRDELNKEVLKLLALMSYVPEDERQQVIRLLRDYVAEMPSDVQAPPTGERVDPHTVHAVFDSMMSTWQRMGESPARL
jgi:hypothetical protein